MTAEAKLHSHLSKSSELNCPWVCLTLGSRWCSCKLVILTSDFVFWSLLDLRPALIFFSAACRLRSGVSPPPFFLLQSRTEQY